MFKQDYKKDKTGFGLVDMVLLIVLLSVVYVSIYGVK